MITPNPNPPINPKIWGGAIAVILFLGFILYSSCGGGPKAREAHKASAAQPEVRH